MYNFYVWFIKNKKRVIPWFFIGVAFVFYSSFLLYLFTDIFQIKLLISSIIVGEICIISRFLINHYFIFNNNDFLSSIIKFHLASLGGFLIWWSILNLINFYGTHYLLASLIAVILSTLFNFTTSFFWIWKDE